MNTEEITNILSTSWEQYVVQNNKRTNDREPRKNVYASAYSPCAKKMYLDMIAWFDVPEFTPDALARMRRGSDRERDLIVDAQRVGRISDPQFTVLGEQQRFTITDRNRRVVISGKVDLQIQFERNKVYPVEIKTWNQNLVDHIDSFEDLLNNKWTKKGAYQLLSYLYAMESPLGFMMLDRPGIPKLLPVELEPNFDKVEEFITLATKACDAKEEGIPPECCGIKEECDVCPYFGTHCNPTTSVGEGAKIFTDPDIIMLLENREKLSESAKEFDRLDALVKKQFRGVEMGIAGDYMIKGSWGKQTKLELPEDKQTQYDQWKQDYTKIDPHGRFSLKITKV